MQEDVSLLVAIRSYKIVLIMVTARPPLMAVIKDALIHTYR